MNIGNHVRIRDSIILPDAKISDSSTINGAIIGEGVVIGKQTRIKKGCVIGDHARIGANVVLAERVSVCPAKEVSESVLTARNIC